MQLFFNKARKNKLITGLIIVAVVSLVVLTSYKTGLLDRLEYISYDYRMLYYRKDVELHPDIEIVLIDDASLNTMTPLFGRFPWPRSVYAPLLEYFAMGGATAVVFDILFSESELVKNDELYTENDLQLIQASAATGFAIHAFQLIHEDENLVDKAYLNKVIPDEFVSLHALRNAKYFNIHEYNNRGFNDHILPMTELYKNTAGVGVVGVDADIDSVYRRIWPFSVYQGSVYPSLALAPLVLKSNDDGPMNHGDYIQFMDRKIPLEEKGNYLVNMVGKYEPYSIAAIFSSVQSIQTGDVGNILVSPDEFENKIVFVGASAVGLEDIKTTPLSTKTPGVLIHASATSNILNEDFLKKQSTLAVVLFVMFFALCTTFGILYFHSIFLQTVVPFGLVVFYTIFSYLNFSQGMVIHMVAPLSAVGFAWLATISYLVFTEGKDKQRVKKMFSQYVSPEILAQVSNHYEDQLTASIGKREHLSILFSDIRSFTNMSEQLAAEQVVDLLNTYFKSRFCKLVKKFLRRFISFRNKIKGGSKSQTFLQIH